MPSVIVIGGGVKGLFAARRLHQRGARVTVLEASEALGGKIRTLRDGSGARAEMGAMRLLDTQEEVKALLQELGLATAPFVEDNDRCPFAVGGARGQVGDLNVGVLADAGLVEAATLEASGLPRDARFGKVLQAAFEGAGEADHGRTVLEYLSAPASDGALRAVARAILELRNGRGGMHSVVRVSEFLGIVKLHSGDPLQVQGGFDRLVAALADQLPEGAVRRGCAATRIVQSDSGVAVHCLCAGGEETLSADAVLVTCPGLQRLRFEPPLPAAQQSGIDDLMNVNIAMKAVLHFRERFWEAPEHGGVLGGTSWVGPSDVNQVYFPQDFGGEGGCGGYLMFYIRGEPMRRWKALDEGERRARALAAVKQLFPAADVEGLCQGMSEQWWDEEGVGAYYLTGAPEVIAKLQPFGKVVLSPVPRGWIDDALLDGAAAVEAAAALLGLPAP